MRKAGEGLCFFGGDGAAIESAEKIIQKALAGSGVVKDFADERGLGGFGDEVAQAFGGGVEALQEKGIDGGVAGDELRGVEIPALVVTVDQRMLNVVEVELPSMMNGGAIFRNLLGARRRTVFCGVVERDGKNVGGAIGEPDASTGEGDLHYFAGEIAGQMGHVLVSGGNGAASGVVVGSEVRGDATAIGGGNERQEIYLAASVENRLRRFNHQFNAQSFAREPEGGLEVRANSGERGGFFGDGDLGKGDEEILRKLAAGSSDEFGQKRVQGTDAASAEFFVKRLDANADEGRQCS